MTDYGFTSLLYPKKIIHPDFSHMVSVCFWRRLLTLIINLKVF